MAPIFTPFKQGIIHPGEPGYVAPGATSQGLDLASILRALRIARGGQAPAPVSDTINDPRTAHVPGPQEPVYTPSGFGNGFDGNYTAAGFYRDPNGVLTPKAPIRQSATQRGFYRDKRGRLSRKAGMWAPGAASGKGPAL